MPKAGTLPPYLRSTSCLHQNKSRACWSWQPFGRDIKLRRCVGSFDMRNAWQGPFGLQNPGVLVWCAIRDPRYDNCNSPGTRCTGEGITSPASTNVRYLHPTKQGMLVSFFGTCPCAWRSEMYGTHRWVPEAVWTPPTERL